MLHATPDKGGGGPLHRRDKLMVSLSKTSA
jgi:hypothetical protein